jgi:outer membrane lipoprotein-sorting protein
MPRFGHPPGANSPLWEFGAQALQDCEDKMILIEGFTGKLGRGAASALLALGVVIGASWTAPANANEPAAPPTDAQMVRQLSDHFASVPAMKGEFLQFGPNGEQTGGVFYIQRPGKIRFNYEKPSAVEVISNGKTVAVHNGKLKTWDFYPLDKTPLKLLLADRIEFDGKTVRNVIYEPDLTTVEMGDDKIFGDSVITLMFDPADFDLRQWTIRDSKGAETSVMVFNVEKGVELSPKLFQFDERAIRMRGRPENNN